MHIAENKALTAAALAAMPQVVRVAPTAGCPSQRPLANIGELWFSHPNMARLLQNGADHADELPRNAADFERLSALLEALPRLGGTPLGEELTADLAALGCHLPLTSAHAAEIWQHTAAALCETPCTQRDIWARMGARVFDLTPATLRDGVPADCVPLLTLPVLLSATSPQFAPSVAALAPYCDKRIETLADLEAALAALLQAAKAEGVSVVALSLCDTPLFVRPDPYHAQQALVMALSGKGARLSLRESALLHVQILRILGRLAVANGLRLLWEMTPKADTVSPPFSPVELYRLLNYLDEWQALPPTCLSLTPAQYDGGLAALLSAFPDGEGVPRLSFGVAGQGATKADLDRAVRFFARNGATARCIGLTDTRTPCLENRTAVRFAAALAEELALFDDAAYAAAEARALLFDRAARFFGVSPIT